MLSSPSLNSFRLLQPEVVNLEPEHFERARTVSDDVSNEPLQWQIYLNSLAYSGFTQWLNLFLEQPSLVDSHESQPNHAPVGTAAFYEVSGFRFCLLTTEHVLHETASIPQTALKNLSLAPHFYIAIEVLEEEEQITLRGFFRHDTLIQHLAQANYQTSPDGFYLLPLSSFDIEVNHLLFDCGYLGLNPIRQSDLSSQTASIPSSVSLPIVNSTKPSSPFQAVRTSLSQWLEGLFEQEWCAIDDFLHPESRLALSTRSYDAGAQRGKLINLGVHLKEETVALLVNIAPEPEDRMMVLVQLHPAAGQRFLSPNFQLTLLSKTGKVLQEVAARSHDNYIQLKPFMGEIGKHFSLAIKCGDACHQEDFVL
jgi:Protein of unknown function (DUF1822)